MQEAMRDELVAAIVYALGHKVPNLSWKRGHDSELGRKIAAQSIADYLALANFRIFKGEPSPLPTADQGPPGPRAR